MPLYNGLALSPKGPNGRSQACCSLSDNQIGELAYVARGERDTISAVSVSTPLVASIIRFSRCPLAVRRIDGMTVDLQIRNQAQMTKL